MQTYAYPVPPDATFDLARGEVLTPGEQATQLRDARLVFLGEHHTDARSHAFQRRVVELLADQGRPLVVALEMFPPAVDEVLEDWRQGRLEELEFLEQAEWYRHWGFPWAHYRDLFELFRARGIALRGVNATRDERKAVRKNDLESLSPELQALLGDADEVVPPHAAYVLNAVGAAGHSGAFAPDSERFKRFYRVQRMWDRLMGVRTARLAEALPDNGVAVLIVGSGHLAHGLGANLHAARTSTLRRLSVWDQVVAPSDLDAAGNALVPIGTADWVRIYLRAEEPPAYPSLNALKLEAATEGVRVTAVRPFGHALVEAFREDDVILSLNGEPVTSPTALRLAYERLPFGEAAAFRVLRDGQERDASVTPQRSPH